jgi:hypothetical protein
MIANSTASPSLPLSCRPASGHGYVCAAAVSKLLPKRQTGALRGLRTPLRSSKRLLTAPQCWLGRGRAPWPRTQYAAGGVHYFHSIGV